MWQKEVNIIKIKSNRTGNRLKGGYKENKVINYNGYNNDMANID
jgi:hypothetical protein